MLILWSTDVEDLRCGWPQQIVMFRNVGPFRNGFAARSIVNQFQNS